MNYSCKGTSIQLDPTGTHTHGHLSYKLHWSYLSQSDLSWTPCETSTLMTDRLIVLLFISFRGHDLSFYATRQACFTILPLSLLFSIPLMLDLPEALSWLGRQAEWHWSWKERGVRGCHSLSRPPGHQSHYSQRAEHFDAHCLYRWHKLKHTSQSLEYSQTLNCICSEKAATIHTT